MAGARHSPTLSRNLGSGGPAAPRPPAPRRYCREQTAPGGGGGNAGALRRGEKGALRPARPAGQTAGGHPAGAGRDSPGQQPAR